MGRKHIIKDFALLDSVQLDADRESAETDVEQVDRVAFDLEWTTGDSPVGVVEVQHRNVKGSDWKVLSFGNSISIDNTNSKHRIEINEVNFKFIRLVYKRTSGDGVLSANIHASTMGA